MIRELELNNRKFKVGDVVRHFKAENNESPESTDYHYLIESFPRHTETGELFVSYRQLYGNMDVYIRPAEMFFSEVDREKYPNVKQKYRLEKVTTVEDLAQFAVSADAKGLVPNHVPNECIQNAKDYINNHHGE